MPSTELSAPLEQQLTRLLGRPLGAKERGYGIVGIVETHPRGVVVELADGSQRLLA
jgi:hypothetical protein